MLVPRPGPKVASDSEDAKEAPEVEAVVGPYKVLRLIGEGGMGTVHEAVDTVSGRHVALKVLTSRGKQKSEIVERFGREARIAAQLTSMHVAKVLGAGTTLKGLQYIAMELLDGCDLGRELDASGRLSIATAVDFIQQAALGLADAHRFGIVHRDIKPANLFVCNVGGAKGRRMIKVLDFGISKMEDGTNITQSFDSFGTPQYMSPEQIRATKHVDGRSDIWSLGIVLYEALCGRTPFDGPSTRIISSIVAEAVPPLPADAEVPAGLAAVLMKALEKNPDNRYQSALDLVGALSPYGPGKRTPIEPVAPSPPTAPSALPPLLGTLLIQTGVISAVELGRALEQQALDGRPLGKILVEHGACTQANIEAAIASQKARADGSAVDPRGPTTLAVMNGADDPPPESGPPVVVAEQSELAAKPRAAAASPPRAAPEADAEPSAPSAEPVPASEPRKWAPIVVALVGGAALSAAVVFSVLPPRPAAIDPRGQASQGSSSSAPSASAPAAADAGPGATAPSSQPPGPAP